MKENEYTMGTIIQERRTKQNKNKQAISFIWTPWASEVDFKIKHPLFV